MEHRRWPITQHFVRIITGFMHGVRNSWPHEESLWISTSIKKVHIFPHHARCDQKATCGLHASQTAVMARHSTIFCMSEQNYRSGHCNYTACVWRARDGVSSLFAHQIEACLNSRPLCPLSADPQDLAALTPGHFLVGSALMSIPEPYTEENLDGVQRWRHTTMMRNHFWRRWQKEVLQGMQLRQKWYSTRPDVKRGELVLLTDDLQPPQRWPLARIEETHPGPDGHVRVVTLRTPTTTLTRPIAKIIRLPIKTDDSSE
ncbi:unnamed protein product [Trichogramma brassicae]|uniref:DUF5641 domain-containing protein n=1 Tax=Trichogramma brassicae TaxID=86971 RepID=A0A6H5IU46_9HYME|nr:unnamed protein product [Trichogramma brassicae]